jgi:hypothetical protein
MSSVDFLKGMDYGFGFNVLEGKTRGSGVKGSSPIAIDSASGQIVNFSLQKVNSLEDFQSSLDINTKVSVCYGFFNASANFELQKNNIFIVIQNILLPK